MTVRIVRAIQTCVACPSQWDAWDDQGRYWYLRYRFGAGTAVQLPSPDWDSWPVKRLASPDLSFEYGEPLDGVIDLPTFCRLAGFELDES